MAVRRRFVHAALCACVLLFPASVPGHAADAGAAAPAPQAAEAPARMFGAESFTLGNGMRVVVIPNRRVPVVTQMVWYRVGSADEQRGQSGLAHFVEHLMFKGSAHMPPGQFSIRVKGMGGDDNAFTGQDYTAYHETVSADRLPEIMAMEADRMQGLLFPPEHVKSERNVVLEERRQRTENDPRGYFGEQMKATLFINHPYGNPVGGWFNEVDALSRDNVSAFYHRWYLPANAVLVISGDTDARTVRPLAERTFGAVRGGPVPPRDWTEAPPMLALPRLVMRDPGIEQPVLQRVYRVPSLRQNRKDALALQVLENILDGGATTRLYKALAVDSRIATSVDLDYDPLAWDDAVLWIEAVPAPGVPLEKLEEALDAQLRLLVQKGVSDGELKEAGTRLNDAAAYARDGVMGPAMLFGRTLVTGGDVDDVETWPSRIEGVTAQDVLGVAKRFLDPDNFARRPYVTGYMLPAGQAGGGESAPAKPRAHGEVIQ